MVLLGGLGSFGSFCVNCVLGGCCILPGVGGVGGTGGCGAMPLILSPGRPGVPPVLGPCLLIVGYPYIMIIERAH